MSSSNSAFNLQGAVKKPALDLGGSLSSLTSTPMSNALNSMQIGGQTTPKISLPSAPTNQPITSHTVSPDGTVKQTYATNNTGNSSGSSSQTAQPKTSGVIQTANSQQNANAGSLPEFNPNAGQFGQNTTGGAQGTPVAQNPAPNSYPGLIGNLAKTSQDRTSLDSANQELENLRKGYATAVGNIESQPIPLQFQQGREQVLGRQYTAQEAAAEQKVANELAARGQSITGLGTAASLAAPIQAPYNTQVLNPTTGLPVNPNAGADMQSAVALQVQKLKAGTTSPADAASALSAYGQAGTNALQQALGPSFNIPQAAGSASAQQSNAQVGGTAAVTANQGIYNDALANSANLQQQLSNVDQLGNLLVKTATDGGINPSSSQSANQTIAQIRSQLSSPAQAAFDSTMQTLTAKIGLLLNVGGGAITDQVRNSANQVISGTLALSALPTVLQQIANEGNIVAANQRDIATKSYQNIQNPSGGSSQGGAVSAGGFSFVQDASGNWVPK